MPRDFNIGEHASIEDRVWYCEEVYMGLADQRSGVKQSATLDSAAKRVVGHFERPRSLAE